ncbi:hypothetical protein F8M41_013186 [Gigaspora margarita]|uniref:Uncharacterized protein n=1 Tax=Gigaspora margarita TaxID=4874 RepID=A0A8H3ZZG0_GIGMA|nr:hypothetical protein F8M41_013186 [Gigaspora margarita]
MQQENSDSLLFDADPEGLAYTNTNSNFSLSQNNFSNNYHLFDAKFVGAASDRLFSIDDEFTDLFLDSNFSSKADLFSKESSHDISVDAGFVDVDSRHYISVEAGAASDQHIYAKAGAASDQHLSINNEFIRTDLDYSLSVETEFVSVNSSHHNSIDVESN